MEENYSSRNNEEYKKEIKLGRHYDQVITYGIMKENTVQCKKLHGIGFYKGAFRRGYAVKGASIHS